MTQDEFKKFWEMIKEDKTYSMEFNQGNKYQGLKNLPNDVDTYLSNNGFVCMNSTTFGN